MVMARDCISTIKDNFENALQVVSIIQHFPNLPIFIVEQPLKGSFGPVADALVKLRLSKSSLLHTVHWNVTGDALSKAIWAPCLITAQINIKTSMPSD